MGRERNFDGERGYCALQNVQLPTELGDPPAATASVANFYGGTGLNFDTPPNLGTLTVTVSEEFNPDTIPIEDVTTRFLLNP